MSEQNSYVIKNTYLETSLLDYPYTLGRSYEAREYLHGCNICQYFFEQGVNEPQDIYKILKFTSEHEEYKEICKQSSLCKPLIDKFISGTYKAKFNGGEGTDDIQVELTKDGEYRLWEGKHRVCIAKRFGIKKLPVVLTIL